MQREAVTYGCGKHTLVSDLLISGPGDLNPAPSSQDGRELQYTEPQRASRGVAVGGGEYVNG